MNTATTPAMIEAAREVAERIGSLPGVLRSRVDDWGTFGNFALFVDIAECGDVDLRVIGNGVKRILRESASGAHLRRMRMPKRIYDSFERRSSRFIGWSSDGRRFNGYGQIAIDLDFYRFDPSSNSFPAIQPEGPFKIGAWGVPAGQPDFVRA